MNAPAAKLRQLRISRGFETAKAAAEFHGWNANTYKSHENGVRPISKRMAAKYARAYKVLAGWLLYDTGPKHSEKVNGREIYKGEIFAAEERPSSLLSIPDKNLAYRKIPRLSWEIMASVTDLKQAIAEATDFYVVPADDKLGAFVFTVKVSDDSMRRSDGRDEESFHIGDDLFFDPEKPVPPGSFILAKVFARNETVFRQYREIGYDAKGRKIVTLHALNSNYADETIVLGHTGETIARLIRHSRDFS